MNNRFPYARVVPWAAPLTILVLAVIANVTFGAPLVVLVLAAGAFLLVIWLLWSSVQALTGESELSFEEAFSFGTRSAEEEQKRAVLRALKDLEYERSVGKISEEDYREYAARYRTEAKRLIQNLNEHLSEQRAQVERELERRLSKADRKTSSVHPDPRSAASTDESAESEREPDRERPEYAEKGLECPACQAKNELDARFCKACGARLREAEESAS